MKKLITTIYCVMLSLFCMGQINLGVGIETELDHIALQGKVQSFFNEKWGGQAGFSLYAQSPNPNRIDAEALYNIAWIGGTDNITLSLLGGLNYWYTGVKGTDRKLGLNAGAQMRIPVQEMHIYLEPKFTVISNSNFTISAGVFF